MKSPLAILNRVKKFELDEQQRILAAELDRETAMVTDLKRLNEEFEKEKAFAFAHPELCDFGLYTEQYLKKKRRMEKQLEVIRQKIESIIDIMADIFKEQKTYEIVEKNRQVAERKKQEERKRPNHARSVHHQETA